MATKSSPTPDVDLEAMLADLDASSSAPSKPVTSTSTAPNKKLTRVQTAEDIDTELADLESLVNAQPNRPHTPRVSTPVGGKSARMSSDVQRSASGRNSEDNRGRKSGESGRNTSSGYGFTPSASTSEGSGKQVTVEEEKFEDARPPQKKVEQAPAPAATGGWWGSLVSAATTAAKTAEAAVKEIQSNEEAKRWAEQVKGNVGVLRGLGGELTHRALPTFTNILHTLAPPISSHERLQIHLTHDILGYPSLDPLVHSTFSDVMSQVEGGDLLVLSRGAQEGRKRSGSYSAAGWQDGPWWRASDGVRDLGSVKGLVEGTKLCRVSAEAFAKEYFHSHGGVEEAARRATEELSQSVPVRSSDIFLAIQAISYSERSDLFGGTSTSSDDTAEKKDEAGDELIAFAIYLHDPVHSITYSTLSQPFPSKWVSWLDVPASQTREPSSTGKDGSYAPYYPADIAQIIEEGGVDPREWAAGHIEQAIGLAIGIVAQRYVAKRMGVGEGQTHHVRRANEGVMADGGGEAARAGI